MKRHGRRRENRRAGCSGRRKGTRAHRERRGCASCTCVCNRADASAHDSLVSCSVFANYVSNLPIYWRKGSGTVIATIKKLMRHGISLLAGILSIPDSAVLLRLPSGILSLELASNQPRASSLSACCYLSAERSSLFSM